MHTAVIKLNPLADPIRPTSQNHNLFIFGLSDFVFGNLEILVLVIRICFGFRISDFGFSEWRFVSGVIIRGKGLKFRGAGIHQFIHRLNTLGLAQGPDFIFIAVERPGNLPIAKTQLFCL